MKTASAFVVGPQGGSGASLVQLARALDFACVEPYAGPEQSLRRAGTPLIFFLFSAVPDVRELRKVAESLRFATDARLRFAPLVYFANDPSIDTLRRCIAMGFDDVIALPYLRGVAGIGERIGRQVGHMHTYYETATYFGPDRRNRGTGGARSGDSDHGGGQFRRIEIVRSPHGISVLRDDFQVEV